MERINRPEDDFREQLSKEDIDRVCEMHDLNRPTKDCEAHLRSAAIDGDLNCLLWLLDTMEHRPEWSWANPWVEGRLQRLHGWLDSSKRVDRALFRKDIGPW